MHCPSVGLASVLRTATVRLTPGADAILDPRRVFADSALKNSAEQNGGITHAVLGITDEAPKDISGPVGRRFQGSAYFLSAWLTFTRPPRTRARTAVLSEWDYVEGVEVVGHERHEKSRMRLVYVGSRRYATSAWGSIFPARLRIIFLQNQNRGSKKVSVQRAPRPNARADFADTPRRVLKTDRWPVAGANGLRRSF